MVTYIESMDMYLVETPNLWKVEDRIREYLNDPYVRVLATHYADGSHIVRGSDLHSIR